MPKMSLFQILHVDAVVSSGILPVVLVQLWEYVWTEITLDFGRWIIGFLVWMRPDLKNKRKLQWGSEYRTFK